MKSLLRIAVLMVIISTSAYAQNVGIGTTTPAYTLDVNGAINARSANAFRMWNANYSVIHRNDGVSYWQLITANNAPDGTFNTLRPYRVVLASGNLIFAQKSLIRHSDGAMGIGTLTPAVMLDVNGDGVFRGNDVSGGTGNFRINGGVGGFVELKSLSPTYGVIIRDEAGTGYYGNIEVEGNALAIGYRVSGGHLFIEQGGNVGIGKSNPTAKLDVNGGIKWGTTGSVLSTNQGGSIELRGASGSVPFIDFTNDANTDYDARIILEGNNKLTVNGANFAVVGTSSATRMKVTASGYPDYVFYDDYPLKSLEEVEEHIDDKGHLPGVPSEKEIVENGLDLNDQSIWQQEKIEELFLHTIELNKQVKTLIETNKKLEDRIQQLEQE